MRSQRRSRLLPRRFRSPLPDHACKRTARSLAAGCKPGAGKDERKSNHGADAGPLAKNRHPKRERNERVDVGDNERPPRSRFDDQQAVEEQGSGRAKQPEGKQRAARGQRGS